MLNVNRHDPDAETGCANVQITECAVWLLHSRPVQLPDECQTGSTPFRGGKDDRNVRRVLELWPRVAYSWDEIKIVSANPVSAAVADSSPAASTWEHRVARLTSF
jgi:hypothetical protein